MVKPISAPTAGLSQPAQKKKKKTWQGTLKGLLLFYVISTLLVNLTLWTLSVYFGKTEPKAEEKKQEKPCRQADILENIFFDKRNGVVATDRMVKKTSDGGKSWSDLLVIKNVPVFEIWVIGKIIVQDGQNISVRLRGATNDLIETRDGGETWEYVLYHTSYYGSRKVKMRTQDHGQTWQQVKEQS